MKGEWISASNSLGKGYIPLSLLQSRERENKYFLFLSLLYAKSGEPRLSSKKIGTIVGFLPMEVNQDAFLEILPPPWLVVTLYVGSEKGI